MRSRKSDNIAPGAWREFVRANWMLPVALIALWPLNWLLHDSGLVDPYVRRIILIIGINMILAVSLQLINGISGQFSLGHAGFMAVGAYLAAYPIQAHSDDGDNPFATLAYYLAMTIVIALAGGTLLGIFVAIRKSARLLPSLPTILLLTVAVWFMVDVAMAAEVDGPPPMYLVWSWAIHGLQGLFAMLISAADGPAEWLSRLLPEAIRPSVSFFVAIIGGGACAAFAGLVVGLPTLRLRGDYLAIATLGFAEIIRVVINNSDPLGRAVGLIGIPRYANAAWIYGGVLVTTVAVWRIAHSSKGRSIAAVREDEIAAAAVGINPTYFKVFAFVVGAFFAGVAGALYAHLNSYINPAEFDFMRSVLIVVVVVLAGFGSITGALVTAAVLTTLSQALREFQDWRMIIYSSLLIVMMLLRPQGILGNRELWWRRRRRTLAT